MTQSLVVNTAIGLLVGCNLDRFYAHSKPPNFGTPTIAFRLGYIRLFASRSLVVLNVDRIFSDYNPLIDSVPVGHGERGGVGVGNLVSRVYGLNLTLTPLLVSNTL